MSTRTPEQQLQKFDHRAGTQEIPTLGGMSRLGDEASIPLRQHHLLVNIRFGPGEMTERPGLSVHSSVGFAACVTGLIETQENSGSGGPLRGLLMGYYNGINRGGNPYWYHLGPAVEEPYDPAGAITSVGVTMVPRDPTTAFLYESSYPLAGTRYLHRPIDPGIGVLTFPTYGPFFPFRFQGKTCALGVLGSGAGAGIAIFSLTGNASGTDGNAGVVALIGTNTTLFPQSVAIRQEIIGGEIKEVLYIGALSRVVRFDGTTLTDWFTNPSAAPGTLHVYAAGQELLILHNASTFTDVDATIYYQPAPGQAITAAVLPVNLFNTAADPTANQGGWTGACKFRDRWYVFMEGGEPQAPAGIPRTAFGRVISAVSGGASLTFATAYTNGPGVAADGQRYYNIGWPIVWQDQIVFLASNTLRVDPNGTFSWNPDDGVGIGTTGFLRIGNYTTASGWQIPAVGGPEQKPGTALTFANFTSYYQTNQHGWHLSMSNTYVHSMAGGTGIQFVQGQPWPNHTVNVLGAVGPAAPAVFGWAYHAFPLGSNQVAFFDDEEEV